MVDRSRARGALYGAAIGDALGMPLEGLSHQNVRTYYRGVKDFTADEKRGDLQAGQWTHRTQLALRLAETIDASGDETSGPPPVHVDPLRRLRGSEQPPAGSAPASMAPVAVRAAAAGWSSEQLFAKLYDLLDGTFPQKESLVAAFGQAQAIIALLAQDPGAFDGVTFVEEVADATAWAESRLAASRACSSRLRGLAEHLDAFPLDLQECCNGTGFAPDEAWPFAVAMVARNAWLIEATMLSAVNVGGDAPTIGACAGALLGALHGSEALPPSWMVRVEGRALLDDTAVRLTR